MNTQLKPTLGTLHLWGIAVGLVISGEYFGWSYGWGVAGTLGFLVTSLMVAAMYTCFIFSFTELTTAIPHAGGPFAYSRRAFGEKGGLIAGLATLIEFVFAPPAIALAIGAYLNVQFPALDPKHAAVGAYIVFMGLNILGVKLAATFELVVCVLAVAELLVFMGVVARRSASATSPSTAGPAPTPSAPRRLPGCLPPFPSPSGSSSPLKALPWPPKKPRTPSAPFRRPTSAASSPW